MQLTHPKMLFFSFKKMLLLYTKTKKKPGNEKKTSSSLRFAFNYNVAKFCSSLN